MPKKKVAKKKLTVKTGPITHLQRVLKKRTLAWVAKKLGYKSHSTVAHWQRKGVIPERAHKAVRSLA